MTAHSHDSVFSSAPASEPKSVPVSHVAGQPDTDTKMVLPPDGNLQPTPEYVTGVKLAVIVAAVAFASFLILLDTMIVSTAIPSITDTFHSLPDIGWYASVYQFGTAAPELLTGRIYTYFSTKWTFLVFFGIFEIAYIRPSPTSKSLWAVKNSHLASPSACSARTSVQQSPLTLMNVIFGSTLPKELRQHAPLVDPAAVVSAGSTDFRTIVPPSELPGVLVAYANSIDHVFYLVADFAAAAGIALWGMGWHDLRIKKDQGADPKPGT